MNLQVRRVVTGHDDNGKAVFVSDGPPARVVDPTGMNVEYVEVWATEDVPTVPIDPSIDPPAQVSSLLPGPNGSRFRFVLFPPEDQLFEPGADIGRAMREFAEQATGFGEVLEADNPGMHTTDTVDYGIVISGELDLELDDGAEVHMKAGDVVVQNGTRHAWRNRSGQPAVMAFIMFGATRRP